MFPQAIFIRNILQMTDKKNKEVVQSIISNVYHIHAVVANTGEGSVNTGDIKSL